MTAPTASGLSVAEVLLTACDRALDTLMGLQGGYDDGSDAGAHIEADIAISIAALRSAAEAARAGEGK